MKRILLISLYCSVYLYAPHTRAQGHAVHMQPGPSHLFMSETPVVTVGHTHFQPKGYIALLTKEKPHKPFMRMYIDTKEKGKNHFLQCEKGLPDIQSQALYYPRGASLILIYVCEHALFKKIAIFNDILAGSMRNQVQARYGIQLLAALHAILQSKRLKQKEKEKHIAQVLTKYLHYVYIQTLYIFMKELVTGRRKLAQDEYNIIMKKKYSHGFAPISMHVANMITQFVDAMNGTNKKSYSVFAYNLAYALKIDYRHAYQFMKQHFDKLFTTLFDNKSSAIKIVPLFTSFKALEQIITPRINNSVKQYAKTIAAMTIPEMKNPGNATYVPMDYRNEYKKSPESKNQETLSPYKTYDMLLNKWVYAHPILRSDDNSVIITRYKNKSHRKNSKIDYTFWAYVFALIAILLVIYVLIDVYIQSVTRKKEAIQRKEEEEWRIQELVNTYEKTVEELKQLYMHRLHRKHISEHVYDRILFHLEKNGIVDTNEDIDELVHDVNACVKTINSVIATIEKTERERVPESNIDHQHKKNMQRTENEKFIEEIEELLQNAKNRGGLQLKLNEIIKNHNDPKFRPSKVKHALLNLKSEIDI